jgi:NAD+ synthase (glutamine-hydrolysing)
MRNFFVINQLRKVVGEANYIPKSPTEICGKILNTVYLSAGPDNAEVKARVEGLSAKIGATHMSCDFSKILQAFKDWIPKNLPFNPRTSKEGGSVKED